MPTLLLLPALRMKARKNNNNKATTKSAIQLFELFNLHLKQERKQNRNNTKKRKVAASMTKSIPLFAFLRFLRGMMGMSNKAVLQSLGNAKGGSRLVVHVRRPKPSFIRRRRSPDKIERTKTPTPTTARVAPLPPARPHVSPPTPVSPPIVALAQPHAGPSPPHPVTSAARAHDTQQQLAVYNQLRQRAKRRVLA